MKSNKVIAYGSFSILIESKNDKWLIKYSNNTISNDIMDKLISSYRIFIKKWKNIINDIPNIYILDKKKDIIY